MRGISAGDERLSRNTAGVDAGPAEQVALDQHHRHAGAGEPASKRRAGLPGADDDRVELPAHRIAMTMTIAEKIATASLMEAAGASLAKAAASLARAACPPRVPITT